MGLSFKGREHSGTVPSWLEGRERGGAQPGVEMTSPTHPHFFATPLAAGIDDARNTARLCWRMVCDGCVLRVTQSLPKDKVGMYSLDKETERIVVEKGFTTFV